MAITEFELMDDMHLSNSELFTQYYNEMATNNISNVEKILNNNPSLLNQLTNAENINELISRVNARELKPKTDIDYYLNNELNRFQDLIDKTKLMGIYNQNIQYYIHNLVYYNGKEYYAFQNPPLGTLPTDTNYWLEYNTKGIIGYGGVNLNFKFTWNNSVQYNPMDAVAYKNRLWFATQSNIGIAPNIESHFPWSPMMMPLQATKTQVSKEVPTKVMLNGDMWFKITKGDDIVQDKWIQKAVMPAGVYAANFFVFGNTIHIIGGRNVATTIINYHQVYDTITNTWSSAAVAPINIEGSYCFVIGDKGYMVGGVLENLSLTNAMYMYNNTDNTWTTKASLPVDVNNINSGCSDGTLGYIFGGTGNDAIPLNIAYSYNPTSDSWTQLANIPVSVVGNSVQLVNGKVYCIGGTSFTGTLSTMYVYDIVTNTWSQGADLLYPSSLHGCFLNNNKIYIAGGFNNLEYSQTNCSIYDIDTNTWKSEISLPYSTASVVGAYCNGKGYLFGGININADFGILNYNQQYQF